MLPFLSKAQKQIEILNAGSLKVDNRIAEGAKRLIGDVQFKHENTLMFCDSAYFYSNNSLDAFGHVHIQQEDGVNLYGDTLRYNGNNKIAVLTSNVLVDKGDMQLTTSALNYDIDKNIGYYITPGKIINKENVLTSDRGTYFSKSNDVMFKNNVVLTNPQFVINCDTMRYNTTTRMTYFLGPTTIKSKENTIYCEAGWYDTFKDESRFSKNAYILNKEQKMNGDSLFYNRKQALGKAFGNVSIVDTTQNITIGGDYATHFELSDISYVTGNALFTQKYDKDTLFLHADTLKAIGNTIPKDTLSSKPKIEIKEKGSKSKGENKKNKDEGVVVSDSSHVTKTTFKVSDGKRLCAYNKVKFFKNDMQGKCDSMVYNMADSLMRLFGKPVIWAEESQLTGDSIRIQTGNKTVQYIEINTGGFIVSQEDTLKFNQIRGKYIKGYFKNNELYRINVDGNGQTIYYAKDKDKITAVNRADCSSLNIYMKDKKVEHITFLTKPDATLYPLNQISPQELLLKDFIWRGKERPKVLKDIFAW